MLRKFFTVQLLLAAACSTTRPSPAPAMQATPPPASAAQPPPTAAVPEEARGRPVQFLPTTVYSGGDGSSIEQAVVVMAESEQAGVRRENEWIFARYGKFRKKGVGIATVERRKLDVITVELADHSEKQIFFDITSFFGKSDEK